MPVAAFRVRIFGLTNEKTAWLSPRGPLLHSWSVRSELHANTSPVVAACGVVGTLVGVAVEAVLPQDRRLLVEDIVHADFKARVDGLGVEACRQVVIRDAAGAERVVERIASLHQTRPCSS